MACVENRMTYEQTELAKRAVACKGFRWMPGMLAVRVRPPVFFSEGADSSRLVGRSYRVTEIRESTVHCAGEAFLTTLLNFAPDLSDPATLGCLLALVREAYNDPSLYVRLSDTTRKSDGIRAWEVLGWLDPQHSPDGRGGSWRGWGYISEAEALVAALGAA